MPNKITKPLRDRAQQIAAGYYTRMPVPPEYRAQLDEQSREALKQAKAAGINDIKQHKNPATVPG